VSLEVPSDAANKRKPRDQDVRKRSEAAGLQSMTKAIGSMVLLGIVIYLFVRGALVMRQRETVTALSGLIAALAQACCGSAPATSLPGDSTPLEERRERDLVRDRQRDERREGHVHAAVLDDAQVLGVKAGDLRRLLLGKAAFVAKPSEPQPEPPLRPLDRLLKGRAESDLRGPMLAGKTFARRHSKVATGGRSCPTQDKS
jgi:hypothetical protein